MNVAGIKSQTKKTYWVDLNDGEVRAQPYSRTDRRYQVEQVVVDKRDGSVVDVELRGSVLKKDGTVGQNWATERLYRQNDWPQWLRSIIGGLA